MGARMTATYNTNKATENDASGRSEHEATHEERLAARLPVAETNQPDPLLQISVGRAGAGSIWLVGIAAAIILGVVLYGLNSPAPSAQDGASRTAAASVPGPGAATGQHTGKTGHS